ncbi:MAG: ABC transporter permease [Ilumatobacteraceae bacterium]
MTVAAVDLTGTSILARFIVRRERVRIAVWIASIVALVAITAASVKGLYPTQAQLDLAAEASEGNAAAIAFNGPAQGLHTVGGEVAFQSGATGLVVMALMSLLMIGRLTRGEEEAGRLELLRSLPIGSSAPTVAASLTVLVMNLAVGALVTVTLLAEQLPVAGSVIFGASFTMLGLVFTCIALVAAQVSENTRVVYGIAGAVLGAAYVLRAVGDIGDGTISWLSPIGWAQKTRPFAGERWWPFLPMIAAAVGLLVVAAALAARRDLGAGIVAPRPGPRNASPALGHPFGLAVRLQRGSVIGWSAGVLFTGIAYGSIANSIDDFVRDNKALADMFARAGGASLTDSYLATSMRILALVGAGFVIQSTLRLRNEETQLHAEPVLATPVARRRWAMSHLLVAAGGSVILLAIAGLSVGISYGLVGGGIAVVPGLLGDALVYTPAMLLMVGLTFALIGQFPRAATAAWGVLSVCFIIGLLGELLGLPGWLMDLSPFDHVPQLPAAHFSALPLIVIIAIAGGLGMAGSAGLRRRDIG